MFYSSNLLTWIDMEIEYAYSFTENVFYTGLGMLRFYFWLIPFGLLYSYFNHGRSLLKLLSALLAGLALFCWEYGSLGDRFGRISYDESGVTLARKNGEVVSLAPEQIDRFWSISIGRSGGWSCYLLVRAKDGDYESFIVRKREHSCESDAKSLNSYFGKR